MRNPYAKSLRVKPQQVICDKRAKIGAELEALYALDDDIPEWATALLNKLK